MTTCHFIVNVDTNDVAMGWAEWAKSMCRGPQVPGKKCVTCTKFTSNHNSQLFMLYMGVLCTWVKLLTDLPILGCELRLHGRPFSRYNGEGKKKFGNEGRNGREGKDMKD